MSLSYYVEKFKTLNTDRSRGHSKPHKVCLLLAVIDLIEVGHFHSNKIYFNDQLKSRFSYYFEQFKQGDDQDTPENPFYFLRSEGFWYHKGKLTTDTPVLKSVSPKSIKDNIDFAYLDDELFDYMKSTIVNGELKTALTVNLDNLADLYARWATTLGKSDKTVKNYLGALRGSISNWMADECLLTQPLTRVNSFHEYKRLTTQAMQLEEFKKKDAKGKGMYSAAIKSYGTFLADVGQVNVKSDVQHILEDTSLNETEKSIMVSTRIGQGRFREELIEYWGGCALTSYPKLPMLVASHIKPWSKAKNTERLDPFNGLLLLANIDKAFDLGFISFTDQGHILISDALEDHDVLGINEGMSFIVDSRHKHYLSYHRENLYIN
ncbi:HNH endonuclease [Photobacterium lipolyticum]|uniref:Restriction endonuclease n=1 Tax=Photobacterium lipolyticum TaxID=266810 RepID=A0A2T3N184_9GAMM|nr:HNH endonuclease [Photobacterium lipolyticum]PSW06031.1 restriction endonuclease [Photobacterium lipolyticum]